MTKIFVSYRRDDERAVSARIRDRLANAFGASNVFMDVDNLQPGQRFDVELQNALAQTDCLLVVIGQNWLRVLKERQVAGAPGFVAQEIAAALNRGITVIPVLIDDAFSPREQDLPSYLSDLVLHQAHRLRHETFGRDADDLISAIREVSVKSPIKYRAAIKKRLIGKGMKRVGIVLSVIWALGLFVWSMGEESWAVKNYSFCANSAYRMWGSSDSPGITVQNQSEYWGRYKGLMEKCTESLKANGGIAAREKLYNSLVAALAPIPFFWLLAFLCLRIARWVATGFSSEAT